jgi:hypothetical protein
MKIYKKPKVYKNKSNKHKSKNKSNKKKNKNKTMKKYKKGGGEQHCCMCNNNTKDSMLTPNECLMKYGKYRSHKICSDCWWNKFAKEGVSHKCPGCQTGKPLNENHQQNKNTIIDLTNDD